MRTEFEEKTGMTVKSTAYFTTVKEWLKYRDKYNSAYIKYLETHTISKNKVREWAVKKIESVPKTEFNRKGFPVSHVESVRNATTKYVLKDLIDMVGE